MPLPRYVLAHPRARAAITLPHPFSRLPCPSLPHGYYRRRKIKDRRGVDDTPTFRGTARPITLYAQTHKYMRYILQERPRGGTRCAVRRYDGDRGRVLRGATGERRKRNKKKVSGSVLTAGAAVSLLLPLLFAPSPTTAAGADLELLLLPLLGRSPEDDVRSAGRRSPIDRRAATGA